MDMERKRDGDGKLSVIQPKRKVNRIADKNFGPMASDILSANVGQACSLLKVLANEDRLLLLCRLAGTRLNVGELERITGIHQPTLSQQLGVLRQEGIVDTEKDGRYVYYRLADGDVARIIHTLWRIYCMRRSSCDNLSER